jgi:ribosomal protein L29
MRLLINKFAATSKVNEEKSGLMEQKTAACLFIIRQPGGEVKRKRKNVAKINTIQSYKTSNTKL